MTIFFAGNACAGVIRADSLQDSGVDSLSPLSSDLSEEAKVAVEAKSSEGMTAVVVVGPSSLAVAAFMGSFSPVLTKPCFCMRLLLEDEVIPASPILDGLIRPA